MALEIEGSNPSTHPTAPICPSFLGVIKSLHSPHRPDLSLLFGVIKSLHSRHHLFINSLAVVGADPSARAQDKVFNLVIGAEVIRAAVIMVDHLFFRAQQFRAEAVGGVAQGYHVIRLQVRRQAEQITHHGLDIRQAHRRDPFAGEAEGMGGQGHIEIGAGQAGGKNRFPACAIEADGHRQASLGAGIAEEEDVGGGVTEIGFGVEPGMDSLAHPGFAGSLREAAVIPVVFNPLHHFVDELFIPEDDEFPGLGVIAGGSPAGGFDDFIDTVIGDGVRSETADGATCFNQIQKAIVVHSGLQ